MSKIIQAVFSSGKFATTTDVFQWDKGDILQIEGLDLPENYEVHFSNSLNTPALVVSATSNSVETPAEVFENSGREVYAWIVVLESANVYHTIGQVRIPINPRGMPADLIPTPGYIPDRSKSAIKEAVDAWLAEHQPEIDDGIPYAVKDALITLFEHVAYIDDQGETYLNNLKRAFAIVKSLVSIDAVLDTGGEEITDSDTLGTLRQYLTVTATYDDGSTAIITDYTLSGTLEEGTSTIIISYAGHSDDVEVEVVSGKTLISISAAFDSGSTTIYDSDTLDDLRRYLTVTAYYDDSSSREVVNYTLSGTLTVGTSTITVSYGGKTTTFDVTVTHATVFYTITNNLTGVTNSNTNARIAEGETYTGVLSANTPGYQPANVSVVVGGNDVTATAYNATNKTITITNVSGNIVIAAVEEEIQVEYGQVYTSASNFRVDLGSLSENVSKVAVDVLLEEQTFSTNVVFCTVGGTTWLGFSTAKAWMWSNGSIQELNGKTVNDIIGERSQVFFAVNSSYKDVGIGFSNGQFTCNMTVFGVKFYGASDNLIGDFVPTSTVGEWKNKLTGTTKTAGRCTNITVVEVT